MKALELIVSFIALLIFFATGEGIAWLTELPIPGSVIGMGVLTISLVTGLLKSKHVEAASDLLLSQLGLFFVPPAVAVMLHFDLIVRDMIPLLIGTFGSLVAVLWSTSFTAQILINRKKGPRD